MSKDWDKICKSIETPPDSDAEDELNVQMVKKNAKRISDVLHLAMPMLDSKHASSTPRGVNRVDAFASNLSGAANVTALSSCESPHSEAKDLPNEAPC